MATDAEPHQQVLRLEVAVHDPVLVAVRQALDQLVDHGLRGLMVGMER